MEIEILLELEKKEELENKSVFNVNNNNRKPVNLKRVSSNPDRLTIYSLHNKIKRIIGYLHQLQESVRPDKIFILFSILMFVLTITVNIIEYFGFNLIQLILNIILLVFSIILFIYALYSQLTFILRREESDGMYLLDIRQDGAYEVRIIRSEKTSRGLTRTESTASI